MRTIVRVILFVLAYIGPAGPQGPPDLEAERKEITLVVTSCIGWATEGWHHCGPAHNEAVVPLLLITAQSLPLRTAWRGSHVNVMPTLLDLMAFPRADRPARYASSLVGPPLSGNGTAGTWRCAVPAWAHTSCPSMACRESPRRTPGGREAGVWQRVGQAVGARAQAEQRVVDAEGQRHEGSIEPGLGGFAPEPTRASFFSMGGASVIVAPSARPAIHAQERLEIEVDELGSDQIVETIRILLLRGVIAVGGARREHHLDVQARGAAARRQGAGRMRL
jgi:hypothetical protein